MVCKHWEGQSVERLEDSLWRQHIPVQGIFICPELWHLDRRQVYCDRLWWQEGHCIWSDLLEQTALDRSMFMLRSSRLFLHLPSLTQTAWMLRAAPGGWAGSLAVPDCNGWWCCWGPGCCVLWLCPSSLIKLTLVQRVQFPKALRRK